MTAFLTLRFGRKRYLTASIFIFIVASFFCGTSPTVCSEIVFWRDFAGGRRRGPAVYVAGDAGAGLSEN